MLSLQHIHFALNLRPTILSVARGLVTASALLFSLDLCTAVRRHCLTRKNTLINYAKIANRRCYALHTAVRRFCSEDSCHVPHKCSGNGL